MITTDEVRHIAKLAKINISEADLEKFTSQLGSILDFFSQLQEVPTDDVPETSQVTGLENVTRPDDIKDTENIDKYLEQAPHQVDNHCVVIPNIM